MSEADWADALQAVGSYGPRQADGGYMNDEKKAFVQRSVKEQLDAKDEAVARVRFECDMLIVKESIVDAREGERQWKWRPVRCWSAVAGTGDEDDYEDLLSRSWSLADSKQYDPVFVFRPLGADHGPLREDWWARVGAVWNPPSAQDEEGVVVEEDGDCDSIGASVKRKHAAASRRRIEQYR